MENSSYSKHKNEITALTGSDFDILEVEFDGGSDFFVVDGFEPPIGGSVHTAPFLQFRGTLINDFLRNNLFAQIDIAAFITKFRTSYDPNSFSSFKISENHRWRYYSSN